jgi:type II pantothenate kinase
MMFLDNSGADLVLGMLPFARVLLKQGTKVVLAANTSPSVNDITVTSTDIGSRVEHTITSNQR